MFFLILDIGQDGTGLEANARFGRDAAALMLQYYQNDYRPIAGNNYYNLTANSATYLYNGNISCLSTDYYTTTPLLKSFRYDKLNRIKQMQTAGVSAGEWGSPTDNFSTEYRYDYNGNILSLQRKDATAQIMHHINYTYNAKNNRLQAITATGINSSNYSYDAIGNLANDSGENISITWNAMNKVKTVVTPNSTLHFAYSPTGQRQIKKTGDKTEYYLHDATGNIMCIYELSGNYLTVKERTIYGSKRIGVYRQRIRFSYSGIVGGVVIAPGSGLVNVLHPQPIISPDGRHYLEGSNRLQVIGVARTTLSLNRYAYKKGTAELKGLSPLMAVRPTFLDGTKTAGLRDYELTDHLSNVMAVISDRKLSVDANSDTITDYYEPQVISFTDYYPFGFPMAERSGNISWYRFGFNGKEDDNEIYMIGAMQNYGFRMYDTRIAKFWGVDPITKEYPMLTPFQFASNSPIWAIDIDGLEAWKVEKEWSYTDISAFGEYATAKIQEYKANKVKDDCANFAIRLLVDYAYENKLPIEFINLKGQKFDMSSFKYKSYKQYLNAVREGIDSKDLILNTYSVRQSETQPGDMEILQYSIHDGKIVNFMHVVIFENINPTNINKSDVVWGNLPPFELTTALINWPRFSPINPEKEKWSIISGNKNSRWNVLNPENMKKENNIENKTDVIKEDTLQ